MRTPITDEQRAERRERDRETARQAVERLRDTEGWQAWLASRRHFHRYSLHNQLLIAMQRPQASRVAGFRAWLKLGYSVRKGEKAIRIWVPMPPSRRQIERWEQEGGDPAGRPRTRFRLGPVFDREQVDPLPPPACPEPLEPPIAQITGEQLAPLLAPLTGLAGEIGSQVRFTAISGPARGSYDSNSRCITVDDCHPANAQVRTLVHELAHALLRAEPGEQDEPFTRAQEELVVESVAHTVCGSLGLDTSGYSIPYLASWAEAAPIEMIEQAAATIDRLARRIEDAALSEQADPQRTPALASAGTQEVQGDAR